MTCEATWHRIEHSGYSEDLPLWLELAQRFGGEVVEVGAGCGRVSCFLAARGIRVTAVEQDADLARALEAARPPGAPVTVVPRDIVMSRHRLDGSDVLVIFPLLVTELIAARHGLDTTISSVRDLLPESARIAFCLSGTSWSEGTHSFPQRSSVSTPSSEVAELSVSDGITRLARRRVDRGSLVMRVEELLRVTADDLSNGLDRPVLQSHGIPAAEGVGAMKVVVL